MPRDGRGEDWLACSLDDIILRCCWVRCDMRTIESRVGYRDAGATVPVHMCRATERLQGKSSGPNRLLTNREARDEDESRRDKKQRAPVDTDGGVAFIGLRHRGQVVQP